MKKGAKTLLLAKIHGKMEMFVPVRQIFANSPKICTDVTCIHPVAGQRNNEKS